MMVKEYRKKPVVVEAFQVDALDSEALNQIKKWIPDPNVEVGIYDSLGDFIDFSHQYFDELADHIGIISKNRDVILNIFVGDYVVKGIDGSVYPVKEDTFKKTYEEVTSQDNSGLFSKAITW